MNAFQPKLAIFDLDGTLVEFPEAYLYQETNRILAGLGWPLMQDAILRSFFAAFDYFAFVEAGAREFFTNHFWANFDHSRYPLPTPLAGVEECLKALNRNGIKVAIATARTAAEEEMRSLLSHTTLLNYIDAVVTRSTTDGDWMDKTEQIANICKHLGIEPADAFMVGDIPPDITSARRAGVQFTIAVLSGGIREDVLLQAEPDLLLPGVADLPRYLAFS